jgi:DNA-binding MarR family transcriptional regulator
MMQRLASDTRRSTAPAVLRQLAWVRYELRRSLRFSEKAARACGVTPQQHQLLLGIAGYTGRGWATISELAEFLQQRQNAVVGLVERAAQRRLVRKEQGAHDRRFVRVYLTSRGQRALEKLTGRHREELARIQAQILTASGIRPRPIRQSPGA